MSQTLGFHSQITTIQKLEEGTGSNGGTGCVVCRMATVVDQMVDRRRWVEALTDKAVVALVG